MLPTVLMLPGTLCDARIFSAQQRALRGKVNLIGASYAGMKDRTQWLQSWLNRLPDKFYVAGFSLGGLFASELLRIAGDRVLGIALIASNAMPASRKTQRKSAMLRRMWLERSPAEVAKHIKPAYFHHEAKRKQFEKLVFDMVLRTPKRSAFAEFAWAAERPSSLQTLRDYAGNVLAVSGQQDRLCPRLWQQAMLAAQPHMHWQEIARCGHFVPLEASAKLSNVLYHWIIDKNKPSSLARIQ